MVEMNSDNLMHLKDDMIAFIEGHGMRHFPALIPEETPRVWWNDPEPADAPTPSPTAESWKDFVEMAKSVDAAMVCIGEDVIEKDMVELLIQELEAMTGPQTLFPEKEKMSELLSQAGKIGHIELAFAHQGILFVHETATDWYKDYRAAIDTIDQLQELIEDGYRDNLEEDPE
jgi:hypothetical protein